MLCGGDDHLEDRGHGPVQWHEGRRPSVYADEREAISLNRFTAYKRKAYGSNESIGLNSMEMLKHVLGAGLCLFIYTNYRP